MMCSKIVTRVKVKTYDSDADPDSVLPNEEVHEDTISIPEIESEDNYNADPGSVSEESDGEVLAAQENAGESDLPNVEEEEVVVATATRLFLE